MIVFNDPELWKSKVGCNVIRKKLQTLIRVNLERRLNLKQRVPKILGFGFMLLSRPESTIYAFELEKIGHQGAYTRISML